MLRNRFVKIGAATMFGAIIMLAPFGKLDKAEDAQYMQQLAQANNPQPASSTAHKLN